VLAYYTPLVQVYVLVSGYQASEKLAELFLCFVALMAALDNHDSIYIGEITMHCMNLLGYRRYLLELYFKTSPAYD